MLTGSTSQLPVSSNPPPSPIMPQVNVADAIRALGAAPQAMPGQQFAEDTQRPAWMDQALRAPAGTFTSPAGPLQVIGPAMYQNAMRHIGIKPSDYNKK